MMKWNLIPIAVAAGLAGCHSSSGGTPYSIKFSATVAGAPFSCTQSYPDIGLSKSTIMPGDLRMYIHDVALVRADGQPVPLALTPDNKWQSNNVALLDFEDGTGNCNTNSPETNLTVVGTAPKEDDYTGVQFALGVPSGVDHLNAETAAPPQNDPAMWWSWLGGYRFIRVDVSTPANSSWNFHLGAMVCSGASMDSITCQFDDQSVVKLVGFTPGSSTVNLDLATLFADSDLDHQVDGVSDQVAGCMSGPGDPECPVLFEKVGLLFESNQAGPPQTLFTVTQ